jgi:hypothetical protein
VNSSAGSKVSSAYVVIVCQLTTHRCTATTTRTKLSGCTFGEYALFLSLKLNLAHVYVVMSVNLSL